MLNTKYSAKYVGGEYGSPDDWGIHHHSDALAECHIPEHDAVIMFVRGKERAEVVAAYLNDNKVIFNILPSITRINWTFQPH